MSKARVEPARLSRTVRIVNQRGLHARAAAKFVQCASRFSAEVSVIKGGQEVPGLSIMGLMMLSALPGSSITIAARGVEAEAALDALCVLVAARFGEE